jgi:hypothetical protein
MENCFLKSASFGYFHRFVREVDCPCCRFVGCWWEKRNFPPGRGLDRRPINGVDYKICQPRLEGCLDALGIGSRQGVFGAKNPMSPTCGFFG